MQTCRTGKPLEEATVLLYTTEDELNGNTSQKHALETMRGLYGAELTRRDYGGNTVTNPPFRG